MSPSPLSAALKWRCGLWVVAGALGVWVLPWFFPPIQRVVSDSYSLGFNNRLAALAAIATTLVLGTVCQRSRLVFPTVGLARTETATPEGEAKWPRLTFVGVTAFTLFCIVVWWMFSPTLLSGEIVDPLLRIDLMLMGRMPYRDFAFNYGPLFLWVPVAFVKLGDYRFGSDVAYFGALLLFTTVGLFLLFYVVRSLEISPRRQALLFAVIALGVGQPPGALGLQYTLVRAVFPFAALLFLHQITERAVAGKTDRRSFSIALWGAGAVMLGFLISPETGAATAMGTGFYALHEARSGRPQMLRILLVVELVFLGGVWILAPHYFNSLKTFGGGAYNFPVWPTAAVVLYLAGLWNTIPRFLATAWQSPTSRGAVYGGWSAVTLILAFAAFGRSDAGHIFYNGLGVFLAIPLVTPLAASENPRGRPKFAVYLTLFGIIFIGLVHSSFFLEGHFFQGIQIPRRNGRWTRVNRNFLGPNPQLDAPAERRVLQSLTVGVPSGARVATPFGCDEECDLLLKRSGRYQPEFYPWPSTGTVFTPAEIARKQSEIGRAKYLLVPASLLFVTDTMGADYALYRTQYLRNALWLPVSFHARRAPLDNSMEMARFIRRHYRLTPRGDGWVLATRRVDLDPMMSGR